ncbi:MAG: hypothetical protein RIS52_1990 [Pseudomonadota bacterium]
MFKRADQGPGVLGNTASLSMEHAVAAGPLSARLASATHSLRRIDWIPDLGTEVGSLRWFRGLATCAALCFGALYVGPGIKPLYGAVPRVADNKAWQETRSLAVQPLALGSDSGRRMAPTPAAVFINNIPERPTLDLVATIGQGDGFARVLARAGVSDAEATRIAQMVSSVVNPADIPSGTAMPIVLGPRINTADARPVQSLDLRARFDMRLEFRRLGGELLLKKIPIAIDKSPLRIQGVVGDGLYRSARAAGAPPKAIEAYIKAIAPNINFDRDLTPDARFDIIVENERAETGEVRSGRLLYAGLQASERTYQLLEWTIDGRTEWYEASGVGQRRASFVMPVQSARISSGFGWRVHPILGYSKFHQGMDYAAVVGTPVYAVADGLVSFAGRHGGNGNYIRLNHSSILGTSYSHLSRIVVDPGSRVAQGQLIGYVGTTGFSTGPHLHFEVFKNGVPVNPAGVSFATTSLLSGGALDAFNARRRALLSIPVAGSR